MISVMMPRESWVAKWNEIKTCMPGIYAINVTQIDPDHADDQNKMMRHGAMSMKGRLGKDEYEENSDDKNFIDDGSDDEAYR